VVASKRYDEQPDSYVGVSGDAKPTAANTLSTFYETDTGTSFVFNGTEWVSLTIVEE